MFKHLVILAFASILMSCNSVKINKSYQKTTTQNLLLGTVGEQKEFVLEQDYNQTAIVQYNTPIRINVSLLDFNKTTFRAFEKASKGQSAKLNITYIDSLDSKPKFLSLEIADRVAVLNALNSKENLDVFQYLQNKPNAHLVSNLTVAFNEAVTNAIMNADKVFLEQDGLKNYRLSLYRENKIVETILLNEGVVFAFKTSGFCWKQNSKYQLEIVDIVKGENKCPNKTYKLAKRAHKKVNYFKL
jgi:hypothetical protein